MADTRRCDKCGHVDDGTLAGRVIEHEYSPGYGRYRLHLCDGCGPRTTLSQFVKLGRRVGTGHLAGAEQLRNLPIAHSNRTR